MQLVSKSVADTQKIAKVLLDKVGRPASHKATQAKATVFALEGELGAGKTVLVKAIAKQLGIKKTITSPTFVLLKSYKLSATSSKLHDTSYKSLVHIDAYRLNNEKDLLALGLEELLADPTNLILIEWAERVKKLIPRGAIRVQIDHVGEQERKFSIPRSTRDKFFNF